jgi:hypothetical protein
MDSKTPQKSKRARTSVAPQHSPIPSDDLVDSDGEKIMLDENRVIKESYDDADTASPYDYFSLFHSQLHVLKVGNFHECQGRIGNPEKGGSN